MGVFTWDIACTGADGAFTLQVPLVLDETGTRGRAKRDVPGQNVANMRDFIARGLTRFAVEPIDLTTLAGNVPAALFAALPDHRPISFGRGALHVEIAEGEHAVAGRARSGRDRRSPRRDDRGAGLSLRAGRRRWHGHHRRLHQRRRLRREAPARRHVRRPADRGPPPRARHRPQPAAALSDPDDGVRGLEHRRQAGRASRRWPPIRRSPSRASCAACATAAAIWVRAKARATSGRGAGSATSAARARGAPIVRGPSGSSTDGCRRRSATTRASAGGASSPDDEARRARAARPPGSASGDGGVGPRAARLRRSAVARDRPRPRRRRGRRPSQRSRARRSAAPAGRGAGRRPNRATSVAGELFAHWPYRGLDHLVAAGARARAACAGSRAASPSGASSATPTRERSPASGPAPAAGRRGAPPRQPRGVRRTDAARVAARAGGPNVSDVRGVHGRRPPRPGLGLLRAPRVDRPRRPLHHQPRVAVAALRRLDRGARVSLLAGHGRARRARRDGRRSRSSSSARATGGSRATSSTPPPAAPPAAKPTTRRPADVRVAPRVPHLRDVGVAARPAAARCSGSDAVVAEGDARRPAATLARDFPDGVRGLVLTNEVPDAFGVHKVVMTPDGDARVALVVPRVEAALRGAAVAALGDAASPRADASVRRTFGFRGERRGLLSGRRDVDGGDGGAWPRLRRPRARACSSALWFEEAYVPAAAIPELAAHLAANADEYARGDRRRRLRHRGLHQHPRRPIHPRAGGVAEGRLRRDDRLR